MTAPGVKVYKKNSKLTMNINSITISSELLMSETLVSDVFLGILFTKERASRKATTESRGTVRRESPLAVSFI